ncbi:MAG: AAA family ATPase [Gemmatimonadota bacterium]
MYEEFYGLREKPFSLNPSPKYVYRSDRYRGTLERLLVGLEQRQGLLLLMGTVGSGKTTLCRDLLEQLDPTRYRTALIFDPFLDVEQMLGALLTEFGGSYPEGASREELLERLHRFLRARCTDGLTCVAVFDEAQRLAPEFLEQVEALSSLEAEGEKLLQIALVGEPELREHLRRPSLAQLDRRVSVSCTLANLDPDELERYVQHRLKVAGAQDRVQFTPDALRRVFEATEGLPRLVNLTCDGALLAGYVEQATRINRRHVEQGLASLKGHDTADAGARPRAGG